MKSVRRRSDFRDENLVNSPDTNSVRAIKARSCRWGAFIPVVGIFVLTMATFEEGLRNVRSIWPDALESGDLMLAEILNASASITHLPVDEFTPLGIRVRAFQKWHPNFELPCFPLEKHWNKGRVQLSPTTTGLLFVKPAKSGSTSAASVTLRIASRLAAQHGYKLCKNRVQHSHASKLQYSKRERQKSVLWSMIRDPTTRIVSQYFHMFVSRQKKSATDENFKEFIQARIVALTSFELKYLALSEFQNDTSEVQEINSVLTGYDFVGVMERFDESLVVLQMLLGLNTSDVMYLRYVDGLRWLVPSIGAPPQRPFRIQRQGKWWIR